MQSKNKTRKAGLKPAIITSVETSKVTPQEELELGISEILEGMSDYEIEICKLSFSGFKPKEIAQQLNLSHKQIGIDVNHVKAKFRSRLMLRMRQSTASSQGAEKIKDTEFGLLNKIKTIFPIQKRNRYDELYAKFQNGDLTKKEHTELMKLSEEVESLNAKRLKYIGELADLRGASFKETVREFKV